MKAPHTRIKNNEQLRNYCNKNWTKLKTESKPRSTEKSETFKVCPQESWAASPRPLRLPFTSTLSSEYTDKPATKGSHASLSRHPHSLEVYQRRLPTVLLLRLPRILRRCCDERYYGYEQHTWDVRSVWPCTTSLAQTGTAFLNPVWLPRG